MTRGIFGRLLPRVALLVSVIAVAAGCGSKAGVSTNQATVSASTAASATSSATPTAVPSPRPATQSELSAMIAAGRAPAERDLQLGDGASCRGDQPCLFTDKATGTVGVQAGFFVAPSGCPNGCGGASCYVYLYQQDGSWHYVNAMCIQAPGLVPGPESYVYVSGGCANVRATPGTSGKVIACLPDQTHVSVEGGPLYTDGKIWWHLKDRGWMAHDFLVEPKATPTAS